MSNQNETIMEKIFNLLTSKFGEQNFVMHYIEFSSQEVAEEYLIGLSFSSGKSLNTMNFPDNMSVYPILLDEGMTVILGGQFTQSEHIEIRNKGKEYGTLCEAQCIAKDGSKVQQEFINAFSIKTDTDQNTEKIPCTNCQTPTPSATYEKTDGLCMKCYYERKPESTSSSNNKGCYIATACYGDFNSPQVIAFRNFRDNYLLKNIIGVSFIKFYYRYSPYWAIKLKNHYLLNRIVRKVFLDQVYKYLMLRNNSK
jgi:hypothetical protein